MYTRLLSNFINLMLQSLPQDFRKKGARLVAAKCTLAARVDNFHETTDGSMGRGLFEDIEQKFEKWQEPTRLKEAKPLPRPDEAPKKKRGGRRVRKMKEKSAVTELRRQANRVQFGKIQEDMFQTDIGFSMGMQAGGSGKVRAAAVDKKTQVSVSKRLQVVLVLLLVVPVLIYQGEHCTGITGSSPGQV